MCDRVCTCGNTDTPRKSVDHKKDEILNINKLLFCSTEKHLLITQRTDLILPTLDVRTLADPHKAGMTYPSPQCPIHNIYKCIEIYLQVSFSALL